MPIAKVQLEDGRIAKFEVPDGTTPDEVVGFASSMFAPQDQKQSATKATDAPSAVDAFNMKLKNALTFGMGPAIDASAGVAAGAVKGLFGGDNSKSYDDYLREAKAEYESADQQHPYASTAGDVAGIVGGIATSLPAKAAGMVAKAAPSLMRQVGKSAATTGGILGAQQAATTEGDFGDKATAGAVGAIGGGVLGAAAPLALRGGGIALKGAKSINDRLRATPEKLAEMQLGKALARDKVDLSALPPGKTLLQSGGKGIADRAEAITQRSNPASDQIYEYAASRSAELPADLSKALGGNFKEQDYPRIIEGIKEQAYAKAKPAYKEAYDAVTSINDPVINKELDKIASAGDWGTLTNEAKKMAAYEGETLGNIDATGVVKSYSTKDLDYMTRALRNLGQATEGMGAMGSKTPIGGLRSKAAGAIRDRMKEINPKFGEATNKFADDVGIYNAAEAGKKANLFGSNYKQALSDYKALKSDDARAAWRIGQAENLHSMIGSNPTSAMRRFNTPQFKEAMKSFYSPEEYNALVGALNGRLKEQGVLNRITGNSRTQARQALQAEDAAMQAGNFVGDVVQQGPVRAAVGAVKDYVVDQVKNTPTQQAADKIVANYILSTPFNLAGKEASGSMPLLKNLLQQQNVAEKSGGFGYNPAASGLLYRTLPLVSGN